MKRILVADDERPVIETISLIVKRELAGEFEVAGHAMSGREAVERAAALSPDIILMDVRMPGLSGLDAIREIRKRGSAAVFILVTAYERFDIAREAVELGIIDYLLKPVSKDRLGQALRNAASALERRSEAERREIEHQEREEALRNHVETALLHGVMLGEQPAAEMGRYCALLGIQEPLAVAAAVVFLPPPGSLNPAEDVQALHEKLRATFRYKTRAIMGPLVAGRSVVLLPVKDEAASQEAVASLRRILHQGHGAELDRGFLRIGFGAPRPFLQAALSWAEALREVLGAAARSGRERKAGEERPFELDDAFLESLVNGSPERARLALSSILVNLRTEAMVPLVERYRLIALFGAACRELAKRGLLDGAAALDLMELEELRMAADGPSLELAAEARFSLLAGRIGRGPHRSSLVSRAIAYVQEQYGKQMSLETAAHELGISPNRLSRLFSEETGKGFSDYLIEYRIEKAKEMLVQPGASIKHVSISCGYPDPNYFSRLFKKVTGLTPTVFSSGTPEANDGQA